MSVRLSLSNTAAARAFDSSSREPRDLKAFWSADPLGAARWFANVAKAAEVPAPLAAEVSAILGSGDTEAFKSETLSALVAQRPELFEVLGDLGAAQTARAATLGWVAAPEQPWFEPPAFTGTLKLVDGVVTLETARGPFQLTFGTEGYHWRDEVETAFLGQTVTVKAFPSEDGKTLTVSQFSPGADDDFVSGRVLVKGDRVVISPSNKRSYSAEITDPTFRALLLGDGAGQSSYNLAGVILPGKVQVIDGHAVYSGFPREGFYLLGRVLEPGTAGHVLETGYNVRTEAAAGPGVSLSTELLPGAQVGPEGDATNGSTEPGAARRSFFRVKPSPTAAESAPTDEPTRRVELLATTLASDVGAHGDDGPLASTVKQVARVVPAALPE